MKRKRYSKFVPASAVFPAIVLAIVGCRARVSSEDPTSHRPAAVSVSGKRQLIRDFTQLYIESEENLAFTARFLGMQIMQNPADMWVIQEIIAEVQPDLVIETGTAYGGSALYYATILMSANPGGRVITIDIDPRVETGIAQIAGHDHRSEARVDRPLRSVPRL